MIRKIVKFTKAWHVYMKGEIASFPANQANRLIEAGYAEPHRETPEGKTAKVQSNVAKDAANLKAIQKAPETKDIKPDKSKSKKKRKK